MTTIAATTKPPAARLRIPAVMKPAGRRPSGYGAQMNGVQGDGAQRLAAERSEAIEPEDADLMGQIAAGDQNALATLYQRHGAACYRLARQITASVTLAEDAVQEAFVGLWRTPDSYQRGRGSVRSWLLGLTHHKAVDMVRREAAEHRRQDAQAVAQTVNPPLGADPASVIWTEMQGAEVRAALLELPEAQRQALTLAYFGGYTQTQIAELTGVPLGTVKTRMFTAMRRLRLRLASLASPPGEGAP
jgi:RNA polymerase sigma factor (sigma-70 family)